MPKTISKGKDLKSPNPDQFLETLRKGLEHIADTAWLENNSPLNSIYFTSSQINRSQFGQLQLTDRPDLDAHLRKIWREWSEFPKTPLQALIWSTLGALPSDHNDWQTQSLLLVSYFDLEQPKQSEIIKRLAIGRSTFYRYLDRAIEFLGAALVKNLKPALKLDQPQPQQLFGRDDELAQTAAQLKRGGAMQIVGGSGMGKTALAAVLADQWDGPVFWYRFRPGITDSLEHLLFALAFFFQQREQPDLWIHLSNLSGTEERPAVHQLLMMIRQNLSHLRAAPPLFCFDEVDLLLPEGLHGPENHIDLLNFLQDWAMMDHGTSPLLFTGQKLLLEPQPERVLALGPLPKEALPPFFNTAVDLDSVIRLTGGNPLLVRLSAMLPEAETPLGKDVEKPATVTLDWFWRNLRQKLTDEEETIVSELSVFPNGAPVDGWRRYKKVIQHLSENGILELSSTGTVSLHPALRHHLYHHLPKPIKTAFHLGAAQLLAERSRFTQAAYHYIEGGKPEMAVWTWYTHRLDEMGQGQTQAALALFAPLSQLTLPQPEDDRALGLLIAELSASVGWIHAGLDALQRVNWPAQSLSTAIAHERRGVLFANTDHSEGSLQEYRKSLEMIEHLKMTKVLDLHTRLARGLMNVDKAKAKDELILARFQLDLLEGQLADSVGEYGTARIHYANALAVADRVTNPQNLARLHEALGVMESRYAHVEAAVDHFTKAGNYHRQYGNIVCGTGQSNTNISFTYLAKRRYAEAIEPGKKAYHFFQSIDNTYWLAINEANLAEATFYVGHIAEATRYAESGLRREVAPVRPYCLYMLGHVARVERRFSEAEAFCLQAIEAAEEIEDPWGEAPARNALGEVLRDAGRSAEARQSHAAALAIWKRLKVEHEVAYTQTLLDQVDINSN